MGKFRRKCRFYKLKMRPTTFQKWWKLVKCLDQGSVGKDKESAEIKGLKVGGLPKKSRSIKRNSDSESIHGLHLT